jgi:2-keto-4-pentenoate hydratase/2-oxohepta-3-ene-1,7-dioic acid hydratase in catechol pathway
VRLARFEHEGRVQVGVVVPDGIAPIAGVLARLGRDPEMGMPELIGQFDGLRDELEAHVARGCLLAFDAVRLRAPLARPQTILCAVANYWEHAKRDPRPLHMFLKNPDAVIGPGDTVVLPETTDPWIFMHEAELALVLKAAVSPVSEAGWRDAIFGYTCLIDVSARGRGRSSWGEFSWLGKSFDTFCPIGPWIVTADEIDDPNDLHVRLWNDGELRHDYNTDDMEHRVPELVAWAGGRVSFRDGDLLACGTNHEGLGALQDGETVTQTIDGVGSLTVTVRDVLGRRWERGVYMGGDSTHPAAVQPQRHAPLPEP